MLIDFLRIFFCLLDVSKKIKKIKSLNELKKNIGAVCLKYVYFKKGINDLIITVVHRIELLNFFPCI